MGSPEADHGRNPLRVVEGIAAPLPLANIDTDVIIRIERLSRLSRGEFGRWAFEPMRYTGSGEEDPAFILNRPGYRHAKILVTGPNFGCGSSREMAVWAIQEVGIACIVGSSFGDIFRSNCLQNGILVVQLPERDVRDLLARCDDPQHAACRVDLVDQTLTDASGHRHDFAIEPLVKQSLLEGLDELGLTLRRSGEIRAHQRVARTRRPWTWSHSDPPGPGA
jgi:3-isopropylmalate/(R)-2-methylmalate dehydratase small subunit